MAEFIGTEEKFIDIDEPIIFENKTDSDFSVSAAIVFRKSGLYDVSIVGRRTIISKVAERKTGHWISVEDKMPDSNTDVLLQFPSNMCVGFYEDSDWAINTGDSIYSEIGYNEEKPIAWMLLPEPYHKGRANRMDDLISRYDMIPAEQKLIHVIFETLAECGIYGEEATIKLIGTLKRLQRYDLIPPCERGE